MYWNHISELTLDSYLANSLKDADLLREKVPDARVIVLEYCDKVFAEVLNGLNERGKEALKVMTPWLVVTLIDHDKFDYFLMDHPLKSKDDGDENYHKEDNIENQEPEEGNQFIQKLGLIKLRIHVYICKLTMAC